MCVTNMPFQLLNANAYHQFQKELVKVIKTYSYFYMFVCIYKYYLLLHVFYLYEEQHNKYKIIP